jgi:hypothetical protein
MAGIEKVRPTLEWLHSKPASSQPGNNRQRNRGLTHATRNA